MESYLALMLKMMVGVNDAQKSNCVWCYELARDLEGFFDKRSVCFNESADSIETKPSRSSLVPYTRFALID